MTQFATSEAGREEAEKLRNSAKGWLDQMKNKSYSTLRWQNSFLRAPEEWVLLMLAH